MTIPPPIEITLTPRDRMSLPEPRDISCSIHSGRTARDFAGLREVDEARERVVGLVDAVDGVGGTEEEGDHEDREEEGLSNGE